MNLVVNGDAESGPGGSADPVAAVTGWVVPEGAPALIAYSLGNGYPGPADPGPPTVGPGSSPAATAPVPRSSRTSPCP